MTKIKVYCDECGEFMNLTRINEEFKGHGTVIIGDMYECPFCRHDIIIINDEINSHWGK